MNASLYLLKARCQWRRLPRAAFPAWSGGLLLYSGSRNGGVEALQPYPASAAVTQGQAAHAPDCGLPCVSPGLKQVLPNSFFEFVVIFPLRSFTSTDQIALSSNPGQLRWPMAAVFFLLLNYRIQQLKSIALIKQQRVAKVGAVSYKMVLLDKLDLTRRCVTTFILSATKVIADFSIGCGWWPR